MREKVQLVTITGVMARKIFHFCLTRTADFSSIIETFEIIVRQELDSSVEGKMLWGKSLIRDYKIYSPSAAASKAMKGQFK